MESGMLADILGPDGLIMVVVLAIVLLFGGSKLPKLARGLGSASHEFRKGISEGEHEAEVAKAEAAKQEIIQPSTAKIE
jgi:sec-independent protein translocase protein TatA